MIHCAECQQLKEDMGEEPDCMECPAPTLVSENFEAWELYSQYINTQFVVDFHAFDFVFDTISRTMLSEKSPSEALGLLEKLITIHDAASKVHRDQREAEIKNKKKA